MARFQMVDSENPNTIAVVTADVDIDSFRKDQNWYELPEEEETGKKPAKVSNKSKVNKDNEV